MAQGGAPAVVLSDSVTRIIACSRMPMVLWFIVLLFSFMDSL